MRESGTLCCHFVDRWCERARCSIDLGVTVATVVLSRTTGQLSDHITVWSHRCLRMICKSLMFGENIEQVQIPETTTNAFNLTTKNITTFGLLSSALFGCFSWISFGGV